MHANVWQRATSANIDERDTRRNACDAPSTLDRRTPASARETARRRTHATPQCLPPRADAPVAPASGSRYATWPPNTHLETRRVRAALSIRMHIGRHTVHEGLHSVSNDKTSARANAARKHSRIHSTHQRIAGKMARRQRLHGHKVRQRVPVQRQRQRRREFQDNKERWQRWQLRWCPGRRKRSGSACATSSFNRALHRLDAHGDHVVSELHGRVARPPVCLTYLQALCANK